MPSERPRSPSSIPSARRETWPVDEPHVLLVDDDRHAAASLAELLGVTGFQVVAAHDGIDALSCLYARRPTAVILDLLMPRMDGLELLQQIKAEKAFTDIPIIAVSGEPGALRAAGKAGADHVLQKPLDTDALVAILADLSRAAEGREAGVGQRLSPV